MTTLPARANGGAAVSETKFTPEPWEVGDCDGATIWANAGTFAFAIGFATSDANVDRETAKANALLMAASPDLYAMLRRLEWAGAYYPGGRACPSCGNVRASGHDEHCSLIAALAKARGQTE